MQFEQYDVEHHDQFGNDLLMQADDAEGQGGDDVVMDEGIEGGDDGYIPDEDAMYDQIYDDSQDFYQPFDSVAGDIRPIVFNLYKTKMCKNWITTGACPYGFKCQFAHGAHEMRQRTRPMPTDAYSMYAGYRIYTSMPAVYHGAPGMATQGGVYGGGSPTMLVNGGGGVPQASSMDTVTSETA
eukprot:PhF_6_TR27873/c2_g1_i1/m.40772